MSQVVVDASLAVKLVLEEDDTLTAEKLWTQWTDQEVERVAPALFVFESISAIKWSVLCKLTTPEIADLAFQEFLTIAQDIRLLTPPGLHERAWEITKQIRLGHVYDAYYVALAEMLGCELWTANEKLYRAALTPISPRPLYRIQPPPRLAHHT